MEFYAAAIPGTEKALCEELCELGFGSVRLNRGGIPFRGEAREGWRACLESRIAQRIQLLLHRFPCPSEDALFDGVKAIDWSPYIRSDQTLSVSAVCIASAITHSGFAALKVKDAIVDQIRARTGQRPSVDRHDPDLRIFLYLANNKAALYLDLSGEPLHRRGYRKEAGEAPLRETLAAAILRMSHWDRTSTLVDPMCGSGTIPIEAALWARNIAPGLSRAQFGFERWAQFGEREATELKELRGQLRSVVTGQSPRIVCSDIDPTVLDIASDNARTAGVKLSFKERDVRDLQGDQAAHTLVTNPPYGVRLEKSPGFCREVAATFSRLHGWRVCLLAGTPDYERELSATPQYRKPLSNGDIDCAFLSYDIK
ncbi:MAG: RNA methyltransferase [Lentisphaerae bacterium]|nr:RNA methyltransferase [Lentisphaerota bacterium]